MARAREVGVADVSRHLLGSAQRAEVPQPHLRVGAVVLDVHRVVLAAFHDAVAVGVPAAGNPAELHRAAHRRPQATQVGIAPRQLPVAMDLHDAAHLAVGGGLAEGAAACEGQVHAEAHHALVVGGVPELHLAHRPGEIAEEKGRGLLVVPDVRARAMAAALRVRDPFPAEQGAVGRAETRLRAQRADVEERGLLHLRRQVAAADGVDERRGARAQRWEPRHFACEHVPGVGVSRRVVVTDTVVARGRRVGRRPRVAVGEVPRQQHGDFARRAGWHVEFHRE